MSSASPETVIEFVDVHKAFGKHVVYERMNLVVKRGETLGIIGGSGMGKSVCLKMIIGLLDVDRGNILVHGEDVTQLDPAGLQRIRRQVAYVFQGGALFDSMSVADNIGYALREHTHMSDAEIRERVLECLGLVGLEPQLLEQPPANLSGGMRKRVALARSIALQPEVILYDEPTTGLDPKNTVRIGDMIQELQRELKVTSVVVTHDMRTAFRVCDRVAMLYERRFPYVDEPAKLWESDDPIVRDFIHGTLEDEDGTEA